ncbi:sigma-70 family RNA polymerase sigma factor [Candidatus Poribacteria bacterium]|nr:sigma-70 family RNA polymerase sigma factor [Candidatus Poribacteria bacterium]
MESLKLSENTAAASTSKRGINTFGDSSGSKVYETGNDVFMQIYMKELARYPTLNAQEEKQLFTEFDKAKENGDNKKVDKIREKIVLSNLRLVFSVAKRFNKNSDLNFLDFIQEGNIGLIKAVDKFDHRRGNKFSTHAVWWIRQSIQRAIVNSTGTVRLPAHVQHEIKEIKQAGKEILKNGKKISIKNLSDKTGISTKKIGKIIRAQKMEKITSLNHILSGDENNVSEMFDLIPNGDTMSPEYEITQNDLKSHIEKALSGFRKRDAEIIRMRYGLKDGKEYTLQQIADVFNLSRERVRQIQNNVLAKLKRI